MADTVKIEGKAPAPATMGPNGDIIRGDAPKVETKPAEGAKAPEGVKPPVEEKKPDDVPMAARFATLARKEKDLVSKSQALKAQEADMRKQMEEFKRQMDEFRQWESELKSSPLSAIEKKGIKFEDIQQQVLNDKKPTADLEVRKLREEVEEYKKLQAAERERLLEAEKKRVEVETREAEEQFKTAGKGYVKANAEKYELIISQGAEAVVPALIIEHYRREQKKNPNKKPVALTYAQAAEIVEKQLEEDIRAALSTKKLSAKVTVQPEEPSRRQDAPQQRTIDNGLTPTGRSIMPNRAKSSQEAFERALAKL